MIFLRQYDRAQALLFGKIYVEVVKAHCLCAVVVRDTGTIANRMVDWV